MKIFSPHTMRMLIPRFSRTFLQKEIIQDPLAASSKSMNTPKIYRTKTGQISMGLYEKMLQEAKEKSLAIPSPDADIPYNFEGIDQIPETKDSFLFQQILNENEIREKTLQTHLIKMYQGFLMSMEVADETYLNEYCEKGFAEKTLEALEKLKMRGERVVAFEDFSVTSGQPFPYQGFFVDQVMVRGLSTIRSENLPKSQYHYYNDLDKLGCVVFTPLSLQDPSNFKTKEQGDKLYDDYKKVLVRCLLRIQSPMRLKLIKPNGQELLESNDNYSYNHLVLFESECEMPPKKKQRRDSYRRVSKFQLETYCLLKKQKDFLIVNFIQHIKSYFMSNFKQNITILLKKKSNFKQNFQIIKTIYLPKIIGSNEIKYQFKVSIYGMDEKLCTLSLENC